MKNKKESIFRYILPSVIVLVLALTVVFAKYNPQFLQSSLLSMFQDIKTQAELSAAPPDLAIDKITYQKIADPNDDFNYFKFKATVVLKNHGGDLTNAKVTLSTDNPQKYSFVKNAETGFYLKRSHNHIIRDFEFLLPGDYNFSQINFSLNITDQEDSNPLNNSYLLSVFDMPAKISSIKLDELAEDNTFVLDFDFPERYNDGHDFKIMINDNLKIEKDDLLYAEVLSEDNVYGYYRVKNTEEIFNADSWTEVDVDGKDFHYFKFSDDPFADQREHYLYIKAEKDGNVGMSNVLKFIPQEKINRGEFAEIFVERADMVLDDEGVNLFDDIDPAQDFFGHVQTLSNLGLIEANNGQYLPEATISRGEVIKPILDYFDVDLNIGNGAPHFEDVDEEDMNYVFVESLYASKAGSVFPSKMNTNIPATKAYLEYLIDAYTNN
jgi:hypothetical protein